MKLDLRNKKILVTGGSGMLGKALQTLLPSAVFLSSNDGDLRNWQKTYNLFNNHKPNVVIHLAARVGGVKANMENMGEFYYDNMRMNTNVLEACRIFKVEKLLSTLSTCVYPDSASHPLKEEDIHNGEPHFSNYTYAYSKRMIDVQSRAYRQQYGCNFITVIPNNIFGTHDNFDLKNSHVIPALVRKIYEAKNFGKEIILWGDGKPLREFTYAADMAKTILFLLKNYNLPEPINVGNTKEYSIKQISELICKIYDYNGEIKWDTSAPRGQFRKPSSDKKLIELGWDPQAYTGLEQSLIEVCTWFEDNYHSARGV